MMNRKFRETSWFLSFLSTLPFVYAIVHEFFPIFSWWQQEYITYFSALTITFVGALHWGYALAQNEHQANTLALLYSTAIVMMCWVFLCVKASLNYYLFGFIIIYIADVLWILKNKQLWWFFKLRAAISAVVLVSLLVVQFGLNN